MALATVQDVKRVMQITGTNPDRDVQLAGALEAAESWFKEESKVDWEHSGVGRVTLYDVNEDALIDTPIPPEATITSVWVDGYRTGYYEYDGRALRLHTSYLTEPFPGAVGRRYARPHRRVDIDFVHAGGVPVGLRDGIARLAGYFWRTGPRDPGSATGTGIVSESLGGYSYSLGKVPGNIEKTNLDEGLKEALIFLKPYLRRGRGRVSVT